MDGTLPHPESDEAPKYWLYETGGELAEAMRRYIGNEELSVRDLGLIRAYLRQWVDSPAWDANPAASDLSKRRLNRLRAKVFDAMTKERIDQCVEMAVDMGMDPL